MLHLSTITSFVHTYFIAIFFIIILSLNLSIPQSRLGTAWHWEKALRISPDFPEKENSAPALKFAKGGPAEDKNSLLRLTTM